MESIIQLSPSCKFFLLRKLSFYATVFTDEQFRGYRETTTLLTHENLSSNDGSLMGEQRCPCFFLP